VRLSVVVPAFNEERALPATLRAIDAARERMDAELVVVDNASTDATAQIAARHGALVVQESRHNVARVRNAGARAASGDVLVWIDADTLVPPEALERIAAAMADPACVGGALDVVHRPARRVLQVYLHAWRVLGLALRMSQGAAQFARRSAFEAAGGYDERRFMGEDVDFQWRLRRHGRTVVLRDCRAVPSPRRFDQWPVWRTFVWTNPLVIALLARRRTSWRGWYDDPPR